MWRHLAPHDAPRPWQRRAMVGRDKFCCCTVASGADPMRSCMALVAWLMVVLCVGLVAFVQDIARLLWW